MKRLLAVLAALVLLPAGEAAAKEIGAARVCGAGDCREFHGHAVAGALAMGGARVERPRIPRPWYRTTVVMNVPGDELLEAERRTTFEMVAVPAARALRGANGSWMAMEPDTVRAYRRLATSLAPHPAATLPGVGDSTAGVRVRNVVEPAGGATEAAGSGSPAWPWLLAGGAALAVVGAGVARSRRRGGPRGDEAS